MRRVLALSVALFLAVVAFLAGPQAARAEDPPPGGKAWERPPFDKDTIALRDEEAPAGWKIQGEERALRAPEKAIQDAVIAAITAEKYPADEASMSFRTLKGPADAVVTLAYVDFFQDPGKVVAGIQEAAKKNGWTVKEVLSPAVLVIASGPEEGRTQVLAQVQKVVPARLAEATLAAVEQNAETAVALAKLVLKIEPKAAPAHFVMALVARPREEGAPAAAWLKAAESMRKAVAADAAFPLEEGLKIQALGELGGWLLQSKGGDDVNKEARDALLQAVEAATKKDPEGRAGIGARYNLACAYARLKDKDPAFKHLTAVLEFAKKNGKIRGISGWWLKDPDFDGLKDDPRWEEIKKNFPDTPTGPDGGGGDGE
jgi:Tfp pilus assembly protein PilF